jgi:hypothetical protein
MELQNKTTLLIGPFPKLESMESMCKLILFLGLLVLIAADNYSDHRVIEISFDSQEAQNDFLVHFPRDEIDIWSNDQRIGSCDQKMDVMLTPTQFSKFINLNTLTSKCTFRIVISDVEELVRLEKTNMERLQKEYNSKMNSLESASAIQDFIYSDEYYKTYQNYDAIIKYSNGLADRYKNMVQIFELGHTVQNRTIWGYRLHAPGAYNPSKPGVWMNSLQHAREWISAGTTQYIAWKILDGYNKTSEIKNILDKVNIHWVPVFNVDGFLATHAGSRMWRKNRRGDSSGRVFGVDLNRNWKAGWGSGSSNNQNSEVYRGPSALSEPENQAVNAYMIRHNSTIKYGVDFHAYSEVVLRPYGKTSTPTPDEARLAAHGARIASAIERVHRKGYRNWRAVQLGLGNGLDDEMYDTHRFVGGFCTELRPSGAMGGGFAPPPSQILPTAQENLAGFVELINLMSRE